MIVNALQRAADVVVQKSIAEGFGLTVAEAMWKARPVVATAVGGIQDQIVDGESGVLLADAARPRRLRRGGARAARGPRAGEADGRGGEDARARRVPRRAQPARLPQPDLAPVLAWRCGELPADEQHRPVDHARGEVAERAADEPGGEAGPHRAPRYRHAAMPPTSPPPSPSCPSRACASRPRCPPPRSRSASPSAARALGRNLRIPGFRKGKVPPPVIIQRVGREAVLDEAVRESIAGWYTAAIDAAKVVPVGEPDLDLGELPGEGEPLRFSIEIGVRPEATLGDYKGLEVGKPRRRGRRRGDRQAEIEQLRERMAKLETVERAAATGDFVVMDFLGTLDGEPFAGGEGRDQMVELGSGRLVPGFEEQLEGASAGDERTVKIEFPEDYGAEELAGQARPSSPSPSRRSRPRSCPSSTTTSPPRPASTRSTSCATTSASASSEAQDAARSRPSSARPRSTPPSPPPRSTCPTRWSRPARASCGTRWPTRSRTRASRSETYLQIAGKSRGRDHRRQARARRARPAPRGRAGRRRRGRGHRGLATRSCSSRSSAPPRPRAARPRSCSSGCARQGRLDSLKRRPRPAQGDRPHRRVREADPVEQVQAREAGPGADDRKGRSERPLDARKLASRPGWAGLGRC